MNTGTISEGNVGETSERGHGAHMGFFQAHIHHPERN